MLLLSQVCLAFCRNSTTSHGFAGWKTPFSQEVLDVVDKLKAALCSSPVLQYYDVNAPTDLYVDASGQSIGTVL